MMLFRLRHREPIVLALGRRTDGACVAAPFSFYPVFLMKALCMALFACAFNL